MPRDRWFETAERVDQPKREERPRAPLVQVPRLVEEPGPAPAPPRVERSPFGRWLRGGRG